MESRYQQAVDRESSARMMAGAAANAAPARATAEHELAWQPFSLELLGKLTEEGKTVLVDFTADWCLTCKSNERLALNKTETKRFVEENGIATLKADKTGEAAEIDDFLRRLGNKAGSVPFYAIFPAGNPNQPILLDGLFTSPRPFLDALAKAGPSRSGKS